MREVKTTLPPLFRVVGGRLVVGDVRQRQDVLEIVRRLGEVEEYAQRIQVCE